MKTFKAFSYWRSYFFVVFCFVSNVLFVQAQDTVDHKKRKADSTQHKVIKNPQQLVNDFQKFELDKNSKDSQGLVPSNAYLTDPRLDSIQLAAWKSYYVYMTYGYNHRAGVFSWQLLSSKLIFCIVLFLVFAGMYFAWLQFKNVMMKKTNANPGSPIESLATELTASLKEVKVSSPVLGVIILIISLLFFYLYLVYIYPIEEIF